MVDLLGEIAMLVAADGIDQRRQRQAGRVQRLQHVVTDGGEEARLDAARAFRLVARDRQLLVQGLEMIERRLQLLGADAHLVLEADRGLEDRVGVGLLIERALDAVHQGVVDFLELGDAPLQGRGRRHLAGLAVSHRHGHDATAARPPNAMPVSVWLRCMALNCSP